MTVTRRQFLVGCSAAIAEMAGGRVSNMIFDTNVAHAQENGTDEIFVLVFCRGGWDCLSLVPPFDDSIYVSQRDDLAVSSALALDAQNASFKSGVGLHPKAAPLSELYQAKQLAIVHACGINNATRSHFEAMDYMERGTPGVKSTPSGWLTRHLQIVGESNTLPTLAAGAATPASLLSDAKAVAMNDINSYSLGGVWRYNNDNYPALLNALKKGYGGDNATQLVGKRTIETIEAIQALKKQNGGNLTYTPKSDLPYGYPTDYRANDFSSALKTVAQTIKLNMGLRVATVDFGGWDTHENEGVNGDGYFAMMVDGLARGLNAFYNDLSDYWGRLTICVVSEFGRRLGANTSGGTDHGHGNVMLLLGGNVNGGKVYGAWPGLENLDQDQDLKVTTDYRTVLSEIAAKRLGNGQLGAIFPGLTAQEYQPLGVVNGSEAAITF